MRIILASKSPRRKELLELMGVKNFEIIVSNADETIEDGLSIEEQSKKLAYQKAKAVFDKTQGERLVIGSDTIVVKNGKIYGKPKDEEEAFQFITELRADTHEVITSLCVIKEESGKVTPDTNIDGIFTVTDLTPNVQYEVIVSATDLARKHRNKNSENINKWRIITTKHNNNIRNRWK